MLVFLLCHYNFYTARMFFKSCLVIYYNNQTPNAIFDSYGLSNCYIHTYMCTYMNRQTKYLIRGHPGLNRGPLDLQSNALPLSYIPTYINPFPNIIKKKIVSNIYSISGKTWSCDDAILSDLLKSMQSLYEALQWSYLLTSCTIYVGERRVIVITHFVAFFEFSLWIKKCGQGDTRVWTGDLSICSRMLYHWAISPHN